LTVLQACRHSGRLGTTHYTSHVFCPPSGFGHGDESFYDFDLPNGAAIWAAAEKVVVSASDESWRVPSPPVWTIITIPTD
jgi:hypothetical protein